MLTQRSLDYNKSKGFFVYDNAVCMQGFAAECALKSIFQQCISRENVVKYGHNIKLLLQDILSFSVNDIEIVSILDPSFGLRLLEIPLENILFFL